MGRPLETKGLLSLPYLLAMDKRLVIRAWTGADTAGSALHLKGAGADDGEIPGAGEEAERDGSAGSCGRSTSILSSYRHRLEGAHVLLGNSKREGFLMTAAEALSCGLPVVVTRSCGVASFVREGVNGSLIDWNDDPEELAKGVLPRDHVGAQNLDPMACLQSVQDLSWKWGSDKPTGRRWPI